MKELKDYLVVKVEGRLEGAEIDRFLASCWDRFEGSREGGMEGRKLLGRMENIQWHPPILSFRIERHGGTASGSTKGELQHWQVDLDQKTASLVKSGHRQLKPMAKRISIQTIADEIVGQILAGTADGRLKWLEDGSIKVVHQPCFPAVRAFRERSRVVESGWSNMWRRGSGRTAGRGPPEANHRGREAGREQNLVTASSRKGATDGCSTDFCSWFSFARSGSEVGFRS